MRARREEIVRRSGARIGRGVEEYK